MQRHLDGASRLNLAALLEEGTLSGVTDGQLLERFATGQGETSQRAFAALVDRHGPMVLRACRSVLGDDHDAMDAFQATFLVLVRKSRSLWVTDSLAPWLHRVACRAAGRARAQAARRRALERGAADATARLPTRDDRDGLASVLHEELNRLPDRYRVPIVLCDLEGRSCEDAARAMGCPVGTIGSRLARGRERLRSRLARRGLAPAVGAVVAALTIDTQAASLPADLAASAARLGAYPGAPVVTSSAAVLAEAICWSLSMTKLISAGAAAAIVAGGCLMLTLTLRPGVGAQVPKGEETPAAKSGPAQLKNLYPFMADKERLKNFVYDEIGNMRPVIKDEYGVRSQSREAVLYQDGTAKLWRLDQKDPIAPTMRHDDPIRALTFFNEATLLFTMSDKSIKVWNGLTGEFRRELRGQSFSPREHFSFSAGAGRFATIDATRTTVTVWDAARVEPIATLRDDGAGPADDAGLSGDGRLVIAFRVGGDPSVRLWDVASSSMFATLRPPSSAVAGIFADGGRTLNKPKIARDARIWEVARSLAPTAAPQEK